MGCGVACVVEDVQVELRPARDQSPGLSVVKSVPKAFPSFPAHVGKD